jgi:hypothetical protein
MTFQKKKKSQVMGCLGQRGQYHFDNVWRHFLCTAFGRKFATDMELGEVHNDAEHPTIHKTVLHPMTQNYLAHVFSRVKLRNPAPDVGSIPADLLKVGMRETGYNAVVTERARNSVRYFFLLICEKEEENNHNENLTMNF